MHLHKRVCLYFHSLRLKISFAKCVRVVMLVTILVLISKNDNQSRMLSITDGLKPQIIFAGISVKTKSGNFEEQACFFSSPVISVFYYYHYCLHISSKRK